MMAARTFDQCQSEAEIDALPDEEMTAIQRRRETRAASNPTRGAIRKDATGGTQVFIQGRWIDRREANDRGLLAEIANDRKPQRQSRFTGAELWDMAFPPVAWIVPDYLAAGLTLLVGAPKLGKSWLALDIARAVAEGGYVLGDRHCVQGSALYAALEDNPRRLKDRLRKVCASKPTAALSIWTEMRMLDERGLDDLRAWIEAADKPRLIVVDVLNKVRAAQGKSEAPYAYDYRSVTPLKDLADEYGLAIVVVHHTRKADAGDKLEKVSGTNGLTGAADTTIILDRDGEGVTLSLRGRDIAEFETALEFDRDTCRWRVLGDAKEVRVSDERRMILEALEGETVPMGPNAIADVSGLPCGSVRFLLNRMMKAGEVQKAGRGKYLHPDISPLTSLTTLTLEVLTMSPTRPVVSGVSDVSAPDTLPLVVTETPILHDGEATYRWEWGEDASRLPPRSLPAQVESAPVQDSEHEAREGAVTPLTPSPPRPAAPCKIIGSSVSSRARAREAVSPEVQRVAALLEDGLRRQGLTERTIRNRRKMILAAAHQHVTGDPE